MLADRFVIPQVADVLICREGYRPFPTADSRREWQALPADLRQARIAAGEKYRGWQWPALVAARYMDYSRDGDRSRYEAPYFARRSALAELVLAECVEGAGRFIDEVINGIWQICEETSWVVPAHNHMHGAPDPLPDAARPAIDLFAGETAGLLAWAHYLLRNQLDAVSARVSARIRYEVKRRLLDPFLERDDLWWMGLANRSRINNWNPWCSSNCLSALLLLEDDPDRRVAGVAKILRILDRFLDAYLPDGGCDEGPTYWTRAGASPSTTSRSSRRSAATLCVRISAATTSSTSPTARRKCTSLHTSSIPMGSGSAIHSCRRSGRSPTAGFRARKRRPQWARLRARCLRSLATSGSQPPRRTRPCCVTYGLTAYR